MRFVVDTNVIISALIKNYITRKIIKNPGFEFFAPSFSFTEINKYRNYICKKSSINKKQFEILLKTLFENIKIIPTKFYGGYITESKNLIDDIKDVPFLACAISLNADIWSDDQHFKKQKKVRILTTNEFIKNFLKKNIQN